MRQMKFWHMVHCHIKILMSGKINSFSYRNYYFLSHSYRNIIKSPLFHCMKIQSPVHGFLILKLSYKKQKTFSSTFINLKFKKMNSYSYNIGLQKAIWYARQIWRKLKELPRWICCITNQHVLLFALKSTRGLPGAELRGLERTGTLPYTAEQVIHKFTLLSPNFPPIFELKNII